MSTRDPLGAAVNAAARIAARAEGGEVLVSEVVRLLTGAAAPVSFVDRGRCRLRGFTERWHLWAVEAGVENHGRPTTIGRPAELAVLEDLVVSTAAGEGRVVLVEGEAGIGKTHLVGEALARATRADVNGGRGAPPTRWCAGRAPSPTAWSPRRRTG